MKLRITEKGWQGYTGFLGQINFVDGVSVEDVGSGQAQAMGAILRCENVEDGQNPSMAQKLVDSKMLHMNIPAPNVISFKKDSKGGVKVSIDGVDLSGFNRTSLEAIADAEGIKGLRAIGDKIGVTSKSVEGLIDGILKAKANATGEKIAEVVEPEATPAANHADIDPNAVPKAE